MKKKRYECIWLDIPQYSTLYYSVYSTNQIFATPTPSKKAIICYKPKWNANNNNNKEMISMNIIKKIFSHM